MVVNWRVIGGGAAVLYALKAIFTGYMPLPGGDLDIIKNENLFWFGVISFFVVGVYELISPFIRKYRPKSSSSASSEK